MQFLLLAFLMAFNRSDHVRGRNVRLRVYGRFRRVELSVDVSNHCKRELRVARLPIRLFAPAFLVLCLRIAIGGLLVYGYALSYVSVRFWECVWYLTEVRKKKL